MNLLMHNYIHNLLLYKFIYRLVIYITFLYYTCDCESTAEYNRVSKDLRRRSRYLECHDPCPKGNCRPGPYLTKCIDCTSSLLLSLIIIFLHRILMFPFLNFYSNDVDINIVIAIIDILYYSINILLI